MSTLDDKWGDAISKAVDAPSTLRELAKSFVNRGTSPPSVDWSGVAKLVAGAFFVAWTFTYNALVQGFTGAIASVLGWIGGFQASVVAALAGIPIEAASAAWGPAASFVSSFGLLSPVIGVTIGLLALYIFTVGVS